MTGLADCNNFFVSCERTVHPELEGKAVIVLSNNDGCAIARSNEAKQLGVRMGQPAFELRDLIRSGRLIAISGHHLLYHDMSVRVHEILRRYAPDTIDYSVDEAFLDFTGIPDAVLPGIAKEIVSVCKREVGIPLTVGIAPTKTLAKISTSLGKKKGENYACYLKAEELKPFMDELPIQELWGIGRRLAKRLYCDGVFTVGGFYDANPEYIRKKLGVNGEKSWYELHGRGCIELAHIQVPLQQSISQTRTFPHDVSDFDYLRSRIAIYAAECSRRLRRMRGICRMVSVFLRSNRFKTGNGYFAPQIDLRLDKPTADSHIIADVAVRGLVDIYSQDHQYKRGGVILSEICPADVYQPSLFDTHVEEENHQDSQDLLSAIDRINSVSQNQIVRLASQITSGVPYHNDGYSSSFGYRE